MYYNKVYFADDRSEEDIFSPAVVSAFKILTDENYYHRTDDEERTYHPKETRRLFAVWQEAEKSLPTEANSI